MKKILLLVGLIIFLNDSSQSQILTRFAIIGDYGKAGTNELNVSNLVKSWNPEYIITLGDNNYDLGEASTIDANIGQYYRQFIFPYTGGYGPGDTVNRFFPSMGNHDWYTASGAAYLNYFTLPGNERYYDYVKGNVHFFVIDSDPNDPDGVDSNSVQAQWLKLKLSQSSEKFNLVYFHHPPFSSSAHGSQVYMQWPFKKWGATTVLAGHEHSYERLYIDSLYYIVNGLGGRSIYAFNTPVSGSQVRYNNNYGAMLAESYNDSLVFRFITVTPTVRDYFTIYPEPKKLHLTSFIQGLYDPLTNTMIGDTIKVLLRNFDSPYEIKDSSTGFLDVNGEITLNYNEARNATDYFLVVKHRNSIETWSSAGNKFILNSLDYDFTTTNLSAYGSNLALSGNRYCIYTGDINQDGTVDVTDISMTANDAAESMSGYLLSDLNGDNYADASDISLVANNATNSVMKVVP